MKKVLTGTFEFPTVVFSALLASPVMAAGIHPGIHPAATPWIGPPPLARVQPGAIAQPGQFAPIHGYANRMAKPGAWIGPHHGMMRPAPLARHTNPPVRPVARRIPAAGILHYRPMHANAMQAPPYRGPMMQVRRPLRPGIHPMMQAQRLLQQGFRPMMQTQRAPLRMFAPPMLARTPVAPGFRPPMSAPRLPVAHWAQNRLPVRQTANVAPRNPQAHSIGYPLLAKAF